MSWLGELWGLIDPGGNSADIRAAATSWQALAADLREIVSSLDPVAADLRQSWKGTASTAYQEAWGRFGAAVAEYADNIDEANGVPATLDGYAAQLDSAHQQAATLIRMIEVSLEVGAGLALFTFGLTEAAADAAAATAVAAGADTIGEALDWALTAARIALEEIVQISINLASRFVLGYTFAWTETALDMAVYGEDPFNPGNWSGDQVAGLIVRGMVTAGVGKVAAQAIPIEEAMEANPQQANMIYFGFDGVLSTTLQQYSVDDNKVDAASVEAVTLNTVLSAFLGGVYGNTYGNLPSAAAESSGAADESDDSTITNIVKKAQKFTGIGKRNLLRSTYRAPASIIQHGLDFTYPPDPYAQSAAQSAMGQVPVPDVSSPSPAPPHIGGGTDTVRPGDTLWGISGKKLNDPVDYPLFEQENPQTSPNGLIFPGQQLKVPELPVLPSGYTVHVIQPGETISGLVGGNPALVQQIAKLNGLPDPSRIFAGKPLILPPGT